MIRISAFALVSLGMASLGSAFMTPKTSPAITTVLNDIPAGYKGGYADSEPQFAYPQLYPDLSDVEVQGNLDNIDKLTRQQKIKWPQFSWLSKQGDESSRIYQQFAPNISRVGYDDEGRVYSIICPQQGFGSSLFGEFNVEVTVTGTRGWVKEDEQNVYADLGVEGKIWFTTDSKAIPLLQTLEDILGDERPFPWTKENAIVVNTFNPRQPWNPLFRLINGTTPEFPHPPFTQHWDEAYGVAHLNVEIGVVQPTGDEKVDAFNNLILKIFNLGSGNILESGSTLSWNVWFTEPELVDQQEWADHAEFWRKSLEVEHRYPVNNTNNWGESQYYDGSLFHPLKANAVTEAQLFHEFVDKFKDKAKNKIKEDVVGLFSRVHNRHSNRED